MLGVNFLLLDYEELWRVKGFLGNELDKILIVSIVLLRNAS